MTEQPMAAALPSRPSARNLFLRLLGLVSGVAWASLLVQIEDLVGPQGLLPFPQMLQRAREIRGLAVYYEIPTLGWWLPEDQALTVLGTAGLVCSGLLVLGWVPWWAVLGNWIAYLSVSTLGQTFLSFQWDALLLETYWCSLWYAPAWNLRQPTSSPWGRRLLWLLLAKLMFLSGVTKWLSGDPVWRDGSALLYHYATQPLPSWISWYMHQAPDWFHRGSVWMMFAIECVGPGLIVLGYWGRVIFALSTLALMTLIHITGNYGFFNMLTAILCIPLFERLERRSAAPAPADSLSTSMRVLRAQGYRWGTRFSASLAMVVIALSFLVSLREMIRTARGDRLPAWCARLVDPLENYVLKPMEPVILKPLAPWRSINGYGLFRVMTTKRLELVLEGSQDALHWYELDFRYKPGAPHRAPPVVAPHMPRLDWQMWFAALNPRLQAHWLQPLLKHVLLGTPTAARLLGQPTLTAEPPPWIRLVVYEYRFTDFEYRRQTHDWWLRLRLGELTPALSQETWERTP
ncbi:MAG: membrane protein [Planctomycetaceae bacterium]|nr:MAG: membrane protein [Planctomycetaceae bacterium]